jgi:hypothetical protein
MRLPEIATRIREIAGERGIPELVNLAEQIGRRTSRRGPTTSRPMTKGLAGGIRLYALAHPGMTQLEIARHFDVNQGRVSETLRGKRV